MICFPQYLKSSSSPKWCWVERRCVWVCGCWSEAALSMPSQHWRITFSNIMNSLSPMHAQRSTPSPSPALCPGSLACLYLIKGLPPWLWVGSRNGGHWRRSERRNSKVNLSPVQSAQLLHPWQKVTTSVTWPSPNLFSLIHRILFRVRLIQIQNYRTLMLPFLEKSNL